MQFRTFLKTGVEVLHLGGQRWESNAWPDEHWREHKGRWRLYTLAIDDFLNEDLTDRSFGNSVEQFVLLLEVADFQSWGVGTAFTGPEGFTSYKHKTKEVWSVGRIDWNEAKDLPGAKQLQAYGQALQFAVAKVAHAKRKPRNFNTEAFAEAVHNKLRTAKVSQLSRAAHEKRLA